jgi:hypothetical protein
MVELFYLVRCDHPTCRKAISIRASDETNARVEAAHRRWACGRHSDFCPEHKEGPPYLNPNPLAKYL